MKPLKKIAVSKSNLLHNFRYLSSLNKKVKIAPVVKSNGYGHGIVNVAKILDSQEAPFFCVDSLFEAYQLKKAKIKTPVLVMGFTDPVNFKLKKLPFSFAVYDIEIAGVLNKYQPGCRVHIFTDTGMHREGIPVKDLPDFLKAMKQFNNLEVEGLMSHLASSQNSKDPLFLNQIKQFKKAKEICKKLGIKPRWFHIGATGSIINPGTRPIIAGVSNLARAGLALYGYSSSTFDKSLKPALTLTTKIAQIKKVSKGEKLGYDGTYTAKKDMVIGVLPIGYYDGVDRRLSNIYPVIGRVSMNITIIDLKHVPNPQVGQEVVVYSNIQKAAEICKTIPYDLLVNLAETTKRIIV